MFALIFTNASVSKVFAYSATSAVNISLSSQTISSETDTVTFTFAEKPIDFTLNDISVTGGTLSNLVSTADPLVYTATFTPTPGSISSGNTVSIDLKPTATFYGGVGGGAWNLAFDGTNMWVTNYFANDVEKVAYDGTVTTYTGTGDGPRGIAFDGTNMWTANVSGNNVTKIAPNGSMTNYGPIESPMDIAFDGTNMWTANGNASVSKITPSGVITTYSGTGTNPSSIAFDGTNMWTASFNDSSVTKVTPSGSMTTYTGTGEYPLDITFDGTNMWTADYLGYSVTKISPTGAMTTYPGLQSAGYGITFDGTNLWVASTIGVSKVTLTGQITNYTSSNILAATGVAVNTNDGSIWVANYNNSGVSKVGFASGVSSQFSVFRRNLGWVTAVNPKSNNNKPLDFIINKGDLKTNTNKINLSFNADSSTTIGYIVSLDPEFKNEVIHPYNSFTKNEDFTLPEKYGTYKVYLSYVSITGVRSPLISHQVVYQNKNIKTKKINTKISVKSVKKVNKNN